MRDAVAKGFAVAALDSTDRVNKQWDSDLTANNVDVKNVQSAINYLIGRGLMTASTPKFSLGMSDGGGFAPKPAYYLGFQANANFCSAGAPDQLMTTTTVPNIWCLRRMTPIPSFFTKVAAFQPSFTSRGVAWAYWVNGPSPVYSKRLPRIPGISALGSNVIYLALKKGGILDVNDYLVASPETSTAWISVLPSVYSVYEQDILDQLDCCYSEHKFYSDHDDAVLAFFRADMKASASPAAPTAPATATPEELTRYANAASYSALVDGDALLVMKQGQIVFENYVGDTTADTAHMLASGTKSFNIALFALGQADGIWTLDEKVAQTITEWQSDPNKSQICIRHLLSLTSGLVDSPQYNDLTVPTLDTYDLAINGSSACMRRVLPASMRPAISTCSPPSSSERPAWTRSSTSMTACSPSSGSVPTTSSSGFGTKRASRTCPAAHFTAREWVNYGKLWIQNGQWEGQQLLDPALMHLAVTYPNTAYRGYGLTWWLNVPTDGTYDPSVDQIPPGARGDGTQIANNAPTDLYMAAGLENQRLYVLPSQNLVIVRYATVWVCCSAIMPCWPNPGNPVKRRASSLKTRPASEIHWKLVCRKDQASASLQYCTHLVTSATAVEPSGIRYSSSMSPGNVHLFLRINWSISLMGVSPWPQDTLPPALVRSFKCRLMIRS